MQRRDFITLLGSTVAWPLAARAQQPAMPVIGVLSAGSPDATLPDIEAAFERGLAERGYVAGRNVTIERRWAGGNYDRLPELAQELVRLNPALIRVGGNVVALAARRATSTIPIVFNIASDPVKLGLAKSFSHPGGNATGICIMTAPGSPWKLPGHATRLTSNQHSRSLSELGLVRYSSVTMRSF